MIAPINPALPPIIIIDNYDSFCFNLYQMLQVLTEHPVTVIGNDAIDLHDLIELRPHRLILSPGPGHPGNKPDFGICADVIGQHQQLGVPILGVCLGHQGIVHYLGGKILQAPEIVHGSSSSIKITKDSCLLRGLPNPFQAMRYHSLLIDETCLPDSLDVIARDTDLNLPMAIQHRSQPMYGVQFHPESIGTPEGELILKNFLELA